METGRSLLNHFCHYVLWCLTQKKIKTFEESGLMFAIIVRPELLKYQFHQCILDFVFSWVHKLQII